MPAEFLHGIIPRLLFSSVNIALLDGIGQFSSGGTLHLFLQGRNRAGYTELSNAITPITYTATQAVQISFPVAARTSATDYHYYIISHSPDGNPLNAIALGHWTNYEADQITKRTLTPLTLSRDEHVSPAGSVATPTDLPSGADLTNGAMRLVVGGVSQSGYYRYERYETRSPDGYSILQPHPGEKWVRTGSPNVGSVLDVFDLDGCAQPLQAVSSDALIPTPTYAADGGFPIKGCPLKIIYRNDSDAPLPAGTPFNLGVIKDGAVASADFDKKLLLTPKGFVNLTDGSLDTSDGIGGVMQDIDANLDYKFGDRTTLVLHKDLPPGAAYYLEVAPNFTVGQLGGRVLEGSQIAISLTPATQSGDPAFAIWKVTGNIVLSDGDRLRVVPGDGLSVRVLSGAALIERFVFPTKGDRSVYGIQPNVANQKITIDGNGNLFYRGTGGVPGSEAVRSLVSCESGYSRVSSFSEPVTVAEGGSIDITLSYPCNSEGYGTVRADYPYLSGVSIGKFNPPYVQLFVRTGGKVFRLSSRLTVLADEVQLAAVSSLAEAIEVIPPTPPSSDFCLFAAPSVAIAADVGGTLTAGTYQVAAVYYFDGSAISSISHDPARGCLSEIPGKIEDLFKLKPDDVVKSFVHFG